jgi:DNA-binding SARP family transcriptional activator
MDEALRGREAGGRSALRVCLLNTPRLVCAGGAVHTLERKDAALLALLALEGPTSRAKAASLLWPDVNDEQARSNLRQRLFRLRRTVQRDVVQPTSLLRLLDDVTLDLVDLQQRLATDSTAGQGDLLGNHDYSDSDALDQWTRGARERWHATRLNLLAQVASQLEADRQIAAALPYAQRMLDEDPLLEHAHRRLMRLHYLRGDRAAALGAYERCREALLRELKARPGAETEALARLVQSSGSLPQPTAAPARPLTTLRPPRLVGRDSEWRQLERARAARVPTLLSGEPGVGKTRLVSDFVAASAGAALYGARPGDERLPYALLARLLHGLAERYAVAPAPWVRDELARIVPSFGAAPPSALEPLRLRQAVAQALFDCHAAGLSLLALDDLHYADAASLELLLALTAASDAPLAWLLCSRAADLPALLQQWAAAPNIGPLLRLGALDLGGVQALLESLALPGFEPERWASALHRHTGGNPMFVLQTLIALLDRDPGALAGAPNDLPVPGHVGALIEQRLALLSPGALKLARMAAIAGLDFDVELAAAVLGQHALDIADSWRELESALMIRDGAFAHDLIFEATLRAVPAPIARVLHRDVATHLQERGAPPARVAAHWDKAGDCAAAAASYEAAARHARARSARREELHALDAAARCHRAAEPPHDDAAFDCEHRGVALLLGLESTDLALQRADALVQRAASDRQRAAAHEARAYVQGERYQSQAALADAEAAAAFAASAGDARLQLLAAQRGAGALMRLGRPDDAVAMQRAQLDSIGSLDDDERLFWLSDHATALDYADHRIEAVQVFDRVIAEAEPLGRWNAANEAWGNKLTALMYLNRAADSIAAGERAIDCGRRAGSDRGNRLIDEMNLAGALRDLGRYAEYLQRAEPLPLALRDEGLRAWAGNAENDLAIGYVWLGRPELARQALSKLPDDVPPVLRAARLFTEARLLRGGSSTQAQAGAAQRVREAHALIEASGGAGRSYVRLKVALELARDDEPTLAVQRTQAIETEAQAREQFALAVHALVMRVALLQRLGRNVEAAAASRELLERCGVDNTPPGIYAPEPWWIAHQALAAAGADAEAAHALRRAVHWIERIALPQVPALFRQSFVERNPINRSILAAATTSGKRR